MINLPEKFLKNMQILLQDEFADFLKEYDKPFLKTLRINTLKCDQNFISKNLSQSLKNKVAYENAFFVDSESKFGSNPLHHAGAIYMQEASALLPVNCISFDGDELVLDMCASPGGKSGQIAERIPNGSLVSNEIITNRAIILKENMIRMGYTNTIVTSTTPQNLTKLGPIFDVILIDAPCSGEGLFRREQKAIEEWFDGINQKNHIRQLEILDLSTNLLKNGGKIIYSTCTFSEQENEDVIKEFLATHPTYSLSDISESVIQNTSAGIDNIGRRVFPHKNKGEGQYMCVLQNTQIETNYIYQKPILKNLNLREQRILSEFTKKYMQDFNFTPKSYEDNICIAPPYEINTSHIYVLKYGISFGKIENNRFIPNHNAFTSLGKYFKYRIDLNFDDPNIQKYLRGESLDLDTNISGYAVLCVQGITLGGVKITNGRANNLYPKYLRNKL